jgi:hypothetical protein
MLPRRATSSHQGEREKKRQSERDSKTDLQTDSKRGGAGGFVVGLWYGFFVSDLEEKEAGFQWFGIQDLVFGLRDSEFGT